MNLQNDTAVATEAVLENTVVETVAETVATQATSTDVPAKKVYSTPYKTRGQWFKEMRESGQLAPRQPKAASEKPAKKVAKSVDAKAAARKEFGRRRFFANRAKAAKDAAIASGATKKVYATPYKTRGQWFKEMRESGQLAPRQPKAQVAETVAAA